jgi:hypothetical protein
MNEKYREVFGVLHECLEEHTKQNQVAKSRLARVRAMFARLQAGEDPDRILTDAQELLNSMRG